MRVPGHPTTIWATTVDGRQVWTRQFTDGVVQDVAADARGGLVLVLSPLPSPAEWVPARVRRLDGVTGAVSWEYYSNDGSLSEVAVHPEGTVFVTDRDYEVTTSLVALEGETGAMQRWTLPWQDSQARASGPIVRADGRVVVLSDPRDGSCTSLDLVELASPTAGGLTVTEVTLASPDCYFYPDDYRLLPDGADGLLIAQQRDGASVRRLGGVTGAVSWEYYSNDGSLSEVAVHPEGTVFVTDHDYGTTTSLVAFEGETGAMQRWTLPWQDSQARASGPIVRADGSVVLLSNPHGGSCTSSLDLVELESPTAGGLTVTGVMLATPDCYFHPDDYRLLPDGADGLLLAQRRDGASVRRLGADGVVSDRTDLVSPQAGLPVIEAEYVVGETVAHARVTRWTGLAPNTYTTAAVTFDPATLTVDSTTDLGADPYVRLRFLDRADAVHYSGPLGGTVGPHDTQVAAGLWAALGSGPALIEGPAFDVASASGFLPGGTQSGNSRDYPSVAFHLPGDLPLVDQGQIVTKEEYIVDIRRRNSLGQFGVGQLSDAVGSAFTVTRFLGDLTNKQIVAYIGHAVTRATKSAPRRPHVRPGVSPSAIRAS